MANILVPFDGSPAGEYALDVACGSAAYNGDEVRAVYVIRVPSQLPISADMAAERARAEDAFTRAHAIADRYGVCLITVVAEARAVGPAIVEAARDCDCIMIGQLARRRFFARFLLDRTLHYVIAHAPCQVLVGYVPSTGAAVAATQRFLLMPATVPEHVPMRSTRS